MSHKKAKLLRKKHHIRAEKELGLGQKYAKDKNGCVVCLGRRQAYQQAKGENHES